MIFFQCICLGITFFIMQYHISKGIQTKSHRLFPLVSVTIALYHFYEIVKYLTGQWEIIRYLEILLVIQMIYVIFFYMLDFNGYVLPVRVVVCTFVALCSVDVAIFASYPSDLYLYIYRYYMAVMISLNILVVVYSIYKAEFTRAEMNMRGLSYLALGCPMAAFFLSKTGMAPQDIAMPLALTMCLVIFFVLMKRDMLSDTLEILQASLYSNSNNAHVLMDSYFCFLGANSLAYQLFPEKGKRLLKAKSSERLIKEAKELYESNKEAAEYESNGRYFACSVRAVYSDEKLKGYVLSLIDITHQKNEYLLMEKLKKVAEEKNNQKSRIMIQTSHDLRSPLHTIIGSSDILLQRSDMNENNLSLIGQIKSAGKNLLAIVNDMLNFTKMEYDDVTLESSSGFLGLAPDIRFAEASDSKPSWIYPKARVLIADDMKLNHFIFKELSAPWRIQVDAVADGKEAVEMVSKNEYDLIILDRLMPVMDGLQTCTAIKRLTWTPIILLSANMSEYDVAEYEPYGFEDYLTKPFTVERLKKVLENNLPKRLREKVDDTEEINAQIVEYNTQELFEGHRRVSGVSHVVLKSYVDELLNVMNNLENWVDTDLEMFRTKVHGIKGLSRQVGFDALGEGSEIMEMAAKARHIEYIKNHLNMYKDDIKVVLDRTLAELEQNKDTEASEADTSDDDLFF